MQLLSSHFLNLEIWLHNYSHSSKRFWKDSLTNGHAFHHKQLFQCNQIYEYIFVSVLTLPHFIFRNSLIWQRYWAFSLHPCCYEGYQPFCGKRAVRAWKLYVPEWEVYVLFMWWIHVWTYPLKHTHKRHFLLGNVGITCKSPRLSRENLSSWMA